MTDLNGRWRHITIPVERFDEETQGIGFGWFELWIRPGGKSDMVFIPDPAAVVGSVYRDSDADHGGDVCVIGKENKPFDQYPRNVSRAIQYEGTGNCGSDADRAGIRVPLFDNVSYMVEPQRMKLFVDTRQAAWNSGRESADNKGF